jgi:hypothetical protein
MENQNVATSAWKPTAALPPNQHVILLVRRWVKDLNGARVSFIAARPDEHMKRLGAEGFSPGVDVMTGRVRSGKVFDDTGETVEIDLDAVLAWTEIPSVSVPLQRAA